MMSAIGGILAEAKVGQLALVDPNPQVSCCLSEWLLHRHKQTVAMRQHGMLVPIRCFPIRSRTEASSLGVRTAVRREL